MKQPTHRRLTALSTVALVATLGLVAGNAPGASAQPPRETGTSVAAPADTDGDSLPDSWETNGYDANGDGVVDVDLPAMGASPNHKDLFVEMDYMSGRLAPSAALDRIVNVFAAAPVSNPDGSNGIRIHLDAGSARGTTYDLGGGNQVPYDSNLRPAARETDAIKAANFDSDRAAVFYYMIWGDDYNGSCSSGYSFAIPGDTFIVTMGPRCGWTVTEDMQVGTFLHELGHGLGLRHGGTDNVNYKPNYLSVMNYSFQFGGVPYASSGAYFGYSNATLPSLDESRLTESAGLGSAASNWKTRYYCPDGTRRYTTSAASNPIDWNCDGDTIDSALATDLNNDNTRSLLSTQNNWASIVFGGGAVGGGSVHALSGSTDLREATKQDYLRLRQPGRR